MPLPIVDERTLRRRGHKRFVSYHVDERACAVEDTLAVYHPARRVSLRYKTFVLCTIREDVAILDFTCGGRAGSVEDTLAVYHPDRVLCLRWASAYFRLAGSNMLLRRRGHTCFAPPVNGRHTCAVGDTLAVYHPARHVTLQAGDVHAVYHPARRVSLPARLWWSSSS